MAMKVIHKAIAKEHVCNALVLLAFFAATAPGAAAKHRAVKPSEQPASVVARLALSGTPAGQMYLQENGDKQYLYIGANSKEGLMVVDVTNPTQPNIMKRLAWPNEGSTGKLQMVGGGIALAKAPENDGAALTDVSPTETVNLLDLSDPTNPRTIQSFSGVTGTLVDDARNLVYITNSDGLWILKHRPAGTASSRPRGCLTEDAFNEFANCQ
jgi:hypothetical protein